jgi:hypothetical protein
VKRQRLSVVVVDSLTQVGLQPHYKGLAGELSILLLKKFSLLTTGVA